MRSAEMKPSKRRHSGIRWRLFAGLTSFTLLTLVLVWVFLIRLLGFFYEKERFVELRQISAELAGHLNDPNLAAEVERIALDKGICIRVFCVEGGKAVQVADADVTLDCIIHHVSPEQFARFHEDARAGGGTYERRMEFDTSAGDEEGGFHVPGFDAHLGNVHAVHARVLNVDGKEFFFALDCELTPVRAIVNTLEVQFFWIAGSMLAVTVLLSFIFSRLITKPLATITEQARGLAEGNYETDFTGRGYREVQDLADALNFAAREIRSTDRLQKELIANISHDLRTPLTMIRGYSEMMRDIPGENSPENVQAIIDETTRLSELVNDLMDLSKLQAGTHKPEPTVFDLTEMVRDTMQRYDQLIRHEGYRITFSAVGSAFVRADRTMILQVIYNLINNAVNYTGENRHVLVTETLHDGVVRLSVADSGEGIPPDKIEQIWDRYYRVDAVHKRAVMGTGLGLSIVKGVLEAHGANYGVDSAVGVGSVFWFELPLLDVNEQDGQDL
ncbi:MAG: HAMP domain-containing histidine kinase [Clostridia bacterium]|nr:HAMP domain-containing histidine kinase [Clostridia bacterium]